MALDAERELTQWTAGIDVNRPSQIGTAHVEVGGKRLFTPWRQASPPLRPEHRDPLKR
jgi:hypothetical protein